MAIEMGVTDLIIPGFVGKALQLSREHFPEKDFPENASPEQLDRHLYLRPVLTGYELASYLESVKSLAQRKIDAMSGIAARFGLDTDDPKTSKLLINEQVSGARQELELRCALPMTQELLSEPIPEPVPDSPKSPQPLRNTPWQRFSRFWLGS